MSDIKYEEIIKDQFVRAIRYAYSGFLAVGLIAINFRDEFPKLLAAVGLTYLLILTFVLGAVIYVIYRYCIGEFIFYPVVHFVHWILTLFNFPQGVTSWLDELGVAWIQRRDAYTYLRAKQTNIKDVQYLDYIHTELHILYITSLELFCFWCFMPTPSAPPISLSHYPTISGLIFLTAMAADIRSHSSEARFWKNSELAGKEKTIALLKEGGFVLSPRRPKKNKQDTV